MLLFTTTELAILMGRPLTQGQGDLVHEMTLDAIRGEVGGRLTDPLQPGVKSAALAVAARVLTNSGGVRSEQAGGMLVTYADAQTGVVLSDDERRRLRRAVGMASGAGMLDIAPAECPSLTKAWRAT
ncbi:hypothetical protein OTB20_08340 [Streptomyces sp. H27-H1]|uniref:hypothetical protein n=1 Tax=Streptomyces sp. H27-H1 TaxID=2996461 RepID=UPI002271ED2B|nr:hypothetical protein [Streptomyces sp. H27-H1]MCY0926213.1 hypothetical protein [Streptomyces sp. H27-H1]